MKRNRWMIALAAVGIHICIGSVYAWSVLTKPIMKEMGLSLKETQWTFSLAILFLGLSAAFLGSYVEKKGPKKAGLVAAIFFCTGMIGTGAAVLLKSLPLLYLFYGIIGGIGLGTGYITPVSTLVKWFPNKRGFATGIAIMGFGLASLVAGPLYQLLISKYQLAMAFEIMGGIYFIIMALSALYLAPPADINKVVIESSDICPITGAIQLSAAEAVKTGHFYVLWWMLFTNITCGIGLLSIVSPMAQEVVKLSPLAAATMVGIVGLVNGCGRIVWASVSDYFGRLNTYILFFIIQIPAFYFLANTTDMLTFQLLVYLIICCYGGGFSTIPAFLSDIFGTKELSAIHGRILTAWAAAGIVGPFLAAWIREMTSGYAPMLIIYSAGFCVSLVVALVLKYKQEISAKPNSSADAIYQG